MWPCSLGPKSTRDCIKIKESVKIFKLGVIGHEKIKYKQQASGRPTLKYTNYSMICSCL